MALEIIPQNPILYPGDVQQFAARVTPSPALWGSSANATLQSDGTLNLSTTSSGSALAQQVVMAGIAGIEWTFDSRMLPTSTGYIQFRLIGALSHSLKVEVKATVTTVSNEHGNVIATINRTVVSGDKYYLEVAGNVLRLYINKGLQATYTTTTATRYPIYAMVEFNPPYAHASPHLTVPILIGQWDSLNPNPDNIWTVTGGSLDDSTSIAKPTFTAGASPGYFTISVQFGGSTFQSASTTIHIPPLTMISVNPLILQPGAKVRLQTNYDAAQTKLVTWSIVSGSGSLSNDEFTAPTTPGSTVVRATYGNQQAELTITVPATITASFSAAQPGEQLTFTTNMTGTISWTADYGTPTGSGSSFLWTAPSATGIVARITASNGSLTQTIEVPVLLKFPYSDPALPLVWERRRTALVSRAEDGTRASRVKDKNKTPFESFELTFRNRTTTELQAVHDFWGEHYPGKRFIFEDKLRNIRKVVYFDSDIRQEGNTRCGINYTFRVIEG